MQQGLKEDLGFAAGLKRRFRLAAGFQRKDIELASGLKRENVGLASGPKTEDLLFDDFCGTGSDTGSKDDTGSSLPRRRNGSTLSASSRNCPQTECLTQVKSPCCVVSSEKHSALNATRSFLTVSFCK